jgi:CO dehydrogenase maturation factor
MVIAVAGKGGTGKSTIAALLVRSLLLQDKKPILAVDADPNSTLGDFLDIKYNCTISDIIEETKGLRNLPDGISKPTHLEYQLQQAITESRGVDLLVMGRPEGPDCYCMANNILRGYLQKIVANYSYVVIDNEAGMEHLSRKTSQNIDHLLLISDATIIGLETARRIKELIDKMPFLNIRNKNLIVNKVDSGTILANAEQITGLNLIAILAHYDELSQQNDSPISKLDNNSASIKSIIHLIEKL